MAMAQHKIRIIGNACITRYDNDEGEMSTIIDSYNLLQGDRNMVVAYLISRRPDISV
jgi:hypothetical protein